MFKGKKELTERRMPTAEEFALWGAYELSFEELLEVNGGKREKKEKSGKSSGAGSLRNRREAEEVRQKDFSEAAQRNHPDGERSRKRRIKRKRLKRKPAQRERKGRKTETVPLPEED